jgi:hypothetical protein
VCDEVVDEESKIIVPVKKSGVKRLDIYSVEELLASYTEELTTEELPNFKFIDQRKKRSNKNRSQRMHFTQNFEANDVPCNCIN